MKQKRIKPRIHFQVTRATTARTALIRTGEFNLLVNVLILNVQRAPEVAGAKAEADAAEKIKVAATFIVNYLNLLSVLVERITISQGGRLQIRNPP